jgi:GT2 family glycosyltransferase
VKLAETDWLLFTDGDVVFSPDALSRAMQYALAEEADHLVLMPDWTMKSHGEAAMHGAMHALSSWTFRLWRVADPSARDFLGVGAFNLIRRSTYDAVGGFEGLRMEVLEDLRLGWKVKRAGFRQRVALGQGLAAVRWSEGAWGVIRNLEKNLFALYRYNVLLTLLACLGLVVQIVLPLLALGFGSWLARLGAATLYVAIAGIYVASRKVTRVQPWYVVAYPLAAGLFLFAMIRSMTLALVRGGVVWRGTLYSLKELRRHAGPFWSA